VRLAIKLEITTPHSESPPVTSAAQSSVMGTTRPGAAAIQKTYVSQLYLLFQILCLGVFGKNTIQIWREYTKDWKNLKI